MIAYLKDFRKVCKQYGVRIPVILDTDDRDKASRYEHLGMKLDRVRSCGERFHMYDLIRENNMKAIKLRKFH